MPATGGGSPATNISFFQFFRRRGEGDVPVGLGQGTKRSPRYFT
jgi:hypothetical protein